MIAEILAEDSRGVFRGQVGYDIIITNLASKYTSAVFSQDLSDHCLIACVRNWSAVKRPPLLTVKRSLKHFNEQAFLIDLARCILEGY